ncbi:MAG: hypothetical protein WCX08_05015 [Candidatus Buchananbacteria bacterium]|jgi:hypothetical protein
MKTKKIAVSLVLAGVVVVSLGIWSWSQIQGIKLTDTIVVHCLPLPGESLAVMWTSGPGRVVVYSKDHTGVFYNTGQVGRFPAVREWKVWKTYTFHASPG